MGKKSLPTSGLSLDFEKPKPLLLESELLWMTRPSEQTWVVLAGMAPRQDVLSGANQPTTNSSQAFQKMTSEPFQALLGLTVFCPASH